jgi:hypothetical protein
VPEGPKSGWRFVVDESMDASHVALFGSTVSPVIGVFQTLFAGNAGHFVPGNTGPDDVSIVCCGDVVEVVVTGGSVVVVAIEVPVVGGGRPLVEVVVADRREWVVDDDRNGVVVLEVDPVVEVEDDDPDATGRAAIDVHPPASRITIIPANARIPRTDLALIGSR